MKKVLMILTSHRLDCFRLCMDMLLNGGSIHRFDHVVLLLNGVRGRHLRTIHRLLRQYPDVPWDIIAGPRGRGWRISNLQNDCVKKYPGALYFKLDEDTFVSSDWDIKLLETYERFHQDPDLSLITATIPNNGLGAWRLLTLFPELQEEFLALPHATLSSSASGAVWYFPHLAEWMMRKFLNLEDANQKVRAAAGERWVSFHERFSINCICYDHRHWLEIGGVQERDEVDWGEWITANRKRVVLDSHCVCHHYTFANQQEWLDRSTLLEDIRLANLPSTVWQRSRLGRQLPRLARILHHLPGMFKRRLKPLS